MKKMRKKKNKLLKGVQEIESKQLFRSNLKSKRS